MQELQLPRVCKCQEEELGDGAAVGHQLPLGMGDLPIEGKTIDKLQETSVSKTYLISHRNPPDFLSFFRKTSGRSLS